MCVYKHKTFSIANVSIYFINSRVKAHRHRLCEMDELFLFHSRRVNGNGTMNVQFSAQWVDTHTQIYYGLNKEDRTAFVVLRHNTSKWHRLRWMRMTVVLAAATTTTTTIFFIYSYHKQFYSLFQNLDLNVVRRLLSRLILLGGSMSPLVCVNVMCQK